VPTDHLIDGIDTSAFERAAVDVMYGRRLP